MKICELDTPSLLLDLNLFEANLNKMALHAANAGKLLRPHVKTHKCSEMAKRQKSAGRVCGFCCAKLSEAAALREKGISEILLTSPLPPGEKIARFGELAKYTPGLSVVTDSEENLHELSECAVKMDAFFTVLVDVDPEMGRTGASFVTAPGLCALAEKLPGLDFAGIQCYAGNLQHLPDAKERAGRSGAILRRGAELVRSLRNDAIPCRIFTGAGTGTSFFDTEIPELTDLQVGSYCVMDAEYAAVGTFSGTIGQEFFPALSLLASVVSANHGEFVTIDAGLKSLYFTPHAPPLVLDADCSVSPLYSYSWFGDEHGRLFYRNAKPRRGTKFRLMLPHCDPTVNLHDSLYAVRNGEVVDQWKIDLRGCSR